LAAAAAEKFTTAENLPEKNAAGHNLAVKIIRPLSDFCPAVEFDTVKFGKKKYVCTATAEDKTVLVRKKKKMGMGLDLTP